MTPKLLAAVAASCWAFTVGAASAAPVLLSTEWAPQACQAWNDNTTLTEGLAEWIKNDKGRGYKVMHLYRTDCPDSPRVELTFENKDGKAWCVYGGEIKHSNLDLSADYIMSAETARWQEMGRGEYGPMKGMMFGRLKFEGPKLEAMGNMGPFENFLLIFGKVPSDTSTCPGTGAAGKPAT